MSETLTLPTFVVGPEPEGRGYRILAHSGVPQRGGWVGNFPLTLLDWAKRHSQAGFSGRFPVAGGSIALRARYFEEGSAGPIALANGIFVPEEYSQGVFANESALFAAIAPVTQDAHFGERGVSLKLDAGARVFAGEQAGLGLAWRDRQVFVAGRADLEEIALWALESIAPEVQRSRIRGWCTTGNLAARGDFLPLQNCNLLVTSADERLVEERFLPGRIGEDGSFSGDLVEDPRTFQMWREYCAAMEGTLEPAAYQKVSQAWSKEMSTWSQDDVGWRFIGALSQQQLSYSAMVEFIANVSRIAGVAVAAALIHRYLGAVSDGDSGKLYDVISLFRDKLGRQPPCARSIDNYVLWSASGNVINQLDADELLGVIRLFDEQSIDAANDGEKRKQALARLGQLDARSIEISRHQVETQRRPYLSRIRWNLRGLSPAYSPAVSIEQARILFARRRVMPIV